MIEDEARSWIETRFGERAVVRLSAYQSLLVESNSSQNLISSTTIPSIWNRHFVDSAQLIDLAPESGKWVDVGAGAGLPGIVVAVLTERPVTLIEPRRLRVEFLRHAIDALGLGKQITVIAAKAQNAHIPSPAAVISARAVARLDLLFDATGHLVGPDTTYVLPKGVSAQSEVAGIKRSWHGVFHVKQSVIDPASGIVIATKVLRR